MEILILEWGDRMHPIIFQNANEYIVLVIYLCFTIYFIIGHHCKIQSELSDLLEKTRSTSSSCTVDWELLSGTQSINKKFYQCYFIKD